MVYFLTGKDRFRLQQFISRLKKDLAAKEPKLVTAVFDDSVNAFAEVLGFLSGETLFPEPKLAVFRSRTNLKEELNQARKRVFELAAEKSKILAIWFDGLRSKLDPASAIKKGIKIIRFDELEGEGLDHWLDETSQEMNIKLSPEVKNWLEETFGSDSGLLFQEVAKLASFRPGGLIELRDLSQVSQVQIKSQFFPLIEFFLQKNKKAVALFLTEIKRGEDPIGLLAGLASALRNLLVLRASKNSWAVPPALRGNHPYWLKSLSNSGRGLNQGEIRQGFLKLIRLDREIKNGQVDAQAALEEFIVSWLGGRPSEISTSRRRSF